MQLTGSPRLHSSVSLRIGSGCFLLPLLFCGCAAYQIGNQSLYPLEIHTVSVPVFQSNSFRRNLGERLTEAVVKEIEKRTPYKVVNDPGADSVLTGRILSETKGVLVPDLTGDAREIEADMHVQVSWVDRKGRLLRDEQVDSAAGRDCRRVGHGRRRARGRPVDCHRPAGSDLPPGRADCGADGEAVVRVESGQWVTCSGAACGPCRCGTKLQA